MPLAVHPGQRQEYVQVIKTEEKGSDVNLATHLLHDAHMGRFEVALELSNDSDLLEPIKIVREQLGKKIGILNPQKNPSRALLPHIDFIKQIRAGALAAAQLPATLSDATGTFTKPSAWESPLIGVVSRGGYFTSRSPLECSASTHQRFTRRHSTQDSPHPLRRG